MDDRPVGGVGATCARPEPGKGVPRPERTDASRAYADRCAGEGAIANADVHYVERSHGEPPDADGRSLGIYPLPDEEEAAAIAIVVRHLLRASTHPAGRVPAPNPWAHAGRLEACGLAASSGFRREWRR